MRPWCTAGLSNNNSPHLHNEVTPFILTPPHKVSTINIPTLQMGKMRHALSGHLSCPRSHSCWVVKLGTRQFGSQMLSSLYPTKSVMLQCTHFSQAQGAGRLGHSPWDGLQGWGHQWNMPSRSGEKPTARRKGRVRAAGTAALGQGACGQTALARAARPGPVPAC